MAISIPIDRIDILEDDILLGELAAIPGDDHYLSFSLIEFPFVFFALDNLLHYGRLGQFPREVFDV